MFSVNLRKGISASLRYKLISDFSEAIRVLSSETLSWFISNLSIYCSIFENHADSDFICFISLFSKVISCLYIVLFFDALCEYSLILFSTFTDSSNWSVASQALSIGCLLSIFCFIHLFASEIPSLLPTSQEKTAVSSFTLGTFPFSLYS